MCPGENHELTKILKNYVIFLLIRKNTIIVFQKIDDYSPQPKFKKNRGVAEWYSTCLACTRSLVHHSAQKKKKGELKERTSNSKMTESKKNITVVFIHFSDLSSYNKHV